MDFYNRKKALEVLETLSVQSQKQARMCVITGRRRMGKTALSLHFCAKQRYLYLFVSKKSESLLCDEFLRQMRAKFALPVIGKISRFSEIFELILKIAKKQHITVIIDEFQEFYHINPTVYADIQKLWDLNHKRAKLHLIFVGSVYSLMHKIFENQKEPLFGRADRILSIQAFDVFTLATILKDHQITDSKTLFDFYVITGAVPKYIDLLLTNQATNYAKILDFLLCEHSPFLQEGKHLLIEEFGREYNIYFSILQLIACGKTARNEIESILEKNIGGYLERLLNDYAVIEKIRPLNAKIHARIQKYKIIDNFIAFWFRFFYRNMTAIENGNFKYVQKIIQRDYATYSGRLLERFFHEVFWATEQFNRIGSYWERGNQNEIDLIAFNDLEKKGVIADIKLEKTKLNLKRLKQSAQRCLQQHPDYAIQWLGLSLEDISFITSQEKLYKIGDFVLK